MPDDATKGVAEHGSTLQPSINLHAPVTAFMFSCSGTQCTTMKARVSPLQYIGPHSGFEPRRPDSKSLALTTTLPLHYHSYI